MKRKSFTIKLSKWARTEGKKRIGGEASLHTRSGKYCCLGFYCKSIHKLSDKKLLTQPMPEDIGQHELNQKRFELSEFKLSDREASELRGERDFANALQTINDSRIFPRKRKLQLIKEIFAKLDITVKVAA